MLPPDLHAQLAAAAARTGMDDALSFLVERAADCAYLVTTPRDEPGLNAHGFSRAGGLPDLPASLEWPAGISQRGDTQGYAGFLAQIDLADVPALQSLPLPRRGKLWFFVRGFTETVVFATLYEAAPGPLAPRPAPTEHDWGFGAPRDLAPTPVHFTRGVSLPTYDERFCTTAAGAAGSNDDNLDDLASALHPEGSEGQIGGYSILPDADPYRAIAFRRLGRSTLVFSDRWESLEAFERYLRRNAKSPDLARLEARRPDVQWIDAHRDQIAAEAASWRLLASFRSGVAGLDIGDAVSLDLFLHSTALADGRFDQLEAEAPMVL